MTPFTCRIIVQPVGGVQPNPPAAGPRFSPDGMWWWDGRSWVPAPRAAPTTGGGGAGTALVITILAGGGILLLVVLLTMLMLYEMGSQMTNVFSNVAGAL